jgi:hypothetical protein
LEKTNVAPGGTILGSRLSAIPSRRFAWIYWTMVSVDTFVSSLRDEQADRYADGKLIPSAGALAVHQSLTD